MTQQLTLKPIIKDMLERAGIEDVYDFPPSAKDCAWPIVITNETYEQTDRLKECEYGAITMDLIAVRETQSDAITAISKVIYALHGTDWSRYEDESLGIREVIICGIPKQQKCDSSGNKTAKTKLEVSVILK